MVNSVPTPQEAFVRGSNTCSLWPPLKVFWCNKLQEYRKCFKELGGRGRWQMREGANRSCKAQDDGKGDKIECAMSMVEQRFGQTML